MRKKDFIVLLACLLAGCAGPQKQYRIGVSQCLDDAWRQKMNNEMQCELLLHPEMEIYTRFAGGNNELQCAQIDSFIRERVDLLIVSPNEAEEVKPAVTRAFRAGIPVIVADRRVTGDEWTAFIGGDNYRVGLFMADWIRHVQSKFFRPMRVLIIVSAVTLLFIIVALVMLFYMQLRLKKEIKEEMVPQLEDVQQSLQLSKRDEAFAERLRQIVDEHLTDPNLNVEFLGSMLQLSRTQIFRRVKTITGKGPLDYIRERRLIRSNELLHTTDMTVQQVAIELCFSSPSYFAKCYKEYFGHLPSER